MINTMHCKKLKNSGTRTRNEACEDKSDEHNHAQKNQEESEGHEKVQFKYFMVFQIEIVCTLFLTFMIFILFYLVSGSSHGGCY